MKWLKEFEKGFLLLSLIGYKPWQRDLDIQLLLLQPEELQQPRSGGRKFSFLRFLF